MKDAILLKPYCSSLIVMPLTATIATAGAIRTFSNGNNLAIDFDKAGRKDGF